MIRNSGTKKRLYLEKECEESECDPNIYGQEVEVGRVVPGLLMVEAVGLVASCAVWLARLDLHGLFANQGTAEGVLHEHQDHALQGA